MSTIVRYPDGQYGNFVSIRDESGNPLSGLGGGAAQLQIRNSGDSAWINVVANAAASAAVPVNVVGGGAGGGVAQLQTRNSGDSAWQNVIQGSATNNVPVGITSPLSSGRVDVSIGATGTAIPVTDNSQSLTVDSAMTADYDTGAGTVTGSMFGIALPASGGPVAGGTATNPFNVALPANQSVNITQVGGATPSATVYLPVRLTDGSSYYTAGGGGGGGTSATDGATYTASTTAGTPMMGAMDDASTTALTEDHVGILRATAQRGLHVNLRTNGGTEIGTSGSPIRVDPTGTTTQPVSGTFWQTTQPVSGTVTANIGTSGSLALESGGNLATLAGTVSSSRVAVNPISGQSGVAANTGATSATTQRVVQANDAGKTILSAGGSAASSGNNTLVAAGTNRLKVKAWMLSTTSTTAVTCIFQSGAGGTELWRVVLQAPTGSSTGAQQSVNAPDWLFATATATLLNLNLSGAITVHWSVSYYDEA